MRCSPNSLRQVSGACNPGNPSANCNTSQTANFDDLQDAVPEDARGVVGLRGIPRVSGPSGLVLDFAHA